MKRVLLILTIIECILIMFLMYLFLFEYHIKINGEKEMFLNVNEEYKESGVTVKYRGKRLKDYKVNGNVNINKIGKYIVEYKVKNKTKKRIVNVVDKEKPTIILNKGNNILVPYNSKYNDPGFKASDNYDGDITKNVKVKENVNTKKLDSYKIEYSVKDSSGNTEVVYRNVKVVDKEKPIIKLKRKIDDYIIKGKKVNLDEYEATDNYDGDLTSKVVRNGKIDFNKVGKYTVEYSVSDSNGNESVLTSTINVQNKNKKGIPVLMYHWFYDDTKGEKAGKVNSHNYISKTNFEKQLKFLSDNNYYYVTFEELEKYIDGKIDLPEKSVILTFDDCANSFFKIALPLAQEYKVPVTSFCITKKDNYQKYENEKYLNFQSHTDSLHVRKCSGTWDGAVMCTPYDEINKDISLSIKKINNTDSFAYPFGHYNDNIIKALKNNNIKMAFTINNGRVKKGMDKYKLPRVRISNTTSIEKYKILLK